MGDQQLSHAQGNRFMDVCAEVLGRRTYGWGTADGGYFAALTWVGADAVGCVLANDGSRLSFGPVLNGYRVVPIRDYPLPEVWDAEVFAPIFDKERQLVTSLLPPEYVQWFQQWRTARDHLPTLKVHPAYMRWPRPTDVPILVSLIYKTFGATTRIDSIDDSGRFVITAQVMEAFELTITQDGSRSMKSSYFVSMSESITLGPQGNVDLPGSWDPLELEIALTDIRAWCVRVLPEDFLGALEAGYGPLPGISGPTEPVPHAPTTETTHD